MIKELTDVPHGVVGVRVGGCGTAHDYTSAVTPVIDEAARTGGRLRCLIVIEPDFTGATPAAVADDVRLGLRAFGAFDGVAVVTDVHWVAATTRWTAFLVPFPLRVFPAAQRGAAAEWLAALPTGAGITLALDEPAGVLTVEVTEALRIEDFETVAISVDPWMHEHGELTGLVMHVRSHPQWAGVGSLLRHVRFVVEHQGKLGRLALVTDRTAADTLDAAADHLVHPQVRAFGYTDLAAARLWAAGS